MYYLYYHKYNTTFMLCNYNMNTYRVQAWYVFGEAVCLLCEYPLNVEKQYFNCN